MEQTRKHRMELTLPSDTEIQMRRRFDAPRALVFAAWTQPEHLVHWFGCGSMSMPVCESDLWPGGRYRYVLREESGQEHPFTGEHLELDPPARLVQTQIYDVPPFNANVATVTVIFEESGGVTTVTEVIRHGSKEARDGHLQSGMESGAALALDRLEDLLDRLVRESSGQ